MSYIDKHAKNATDVALMATNCFSIRWCITAALHPDSKRGHVIPKKERTLIDATGGSATYGEVMPEGIDALVARLAMTKDDVFMGMCR